MEHPLAIVLVLAAAFCFAWLLSNPFIEWMKSLQDEPSHEEEREADEDLYGPTMILLRGLPGAGKTTVADFITRYMDLKVGVSVFAADDYFTNDVTGEYKFDVTKLGEAHSQCLYNTESALHDLTRIKGVDYPGVVIVHNTFTTEKELKPYLDLADSYGVNVFSLIVENRHRNKSVHGVPVETMRKMEKRFTFRLAPEESIEHKDIV